MIGFLDSGIGGFSIVESCSDVLRVHLSYYFLDSKNAPYGNKSKKKLEKIVFKNCLKLQKIGCGIIVLACNTATAAAAAYVRKRLKNVKIIGTEPNVLAPIKENKNKILVLATKGTAKYSRILNEHKNEIEVYSPKDLAMKIEHNEDINLTEILPLKSPESYDAVVIGCTHYSAIIEQLKSYFIAAKFYDSKEGVAKQLKKVANEPIVIKNE